MNLIMVNLNMSKYTIITLDEVHSTNSYAIENAPFFDNGNVIFTPHQISGRGRYNRKWICDDSENIYMSIVLKPSDIKNFPFTNLTQYLSVVVCKFLEKEFNLLPKIKWPNDILIDGHKISGILAETYMENNEIKAVILGLGLNVNLKQQTIDTIDQKATSLSVLTGKNYDCELLTRKICDLFFSEYDLFVEKGFDFIKEDYIQRCDFLGKNISIRENNETRQYLAKAIDDEGLLIAIDEFNNECRIITGDVLC